MPTLPALVWTLLACGSARPPTGGGDAPITVTGAAERTSAGVSVVFSTQVGGEVDELSYPDGALRELTLTTADGAPLSGCAQRYSPTLEGGRVELSCPWAGGAVTALRVSGAFVALNRDGSEIERLALPETIPVGREGGG